ncbi:F-box protein [Phanerochaete sordida]|uniref:F-box protein n=1 Tax=Phanerochaete sordida TaxID=48140 RepID=A0A9P3GSI6_9APHY|nr:F-box protein [Phanerochaete sordida]
MPSSSSPTSPLVAGLPDELLSKVFQACNPPPPDADVIEANCEFEDVNYDIQLLHLKQVCRRWKVLVEESPLLWTHISLAFQHADYISEALQRSKECLLVVHSAPGYSTGHSRYGERKVKSDERQAELLVGLLRKHLHRIRVLAVAHTVQKAIGGGLQPGDLSQATALEHFLLPTSSQLFENSVWIAILLSAPKLRAMRCFGYLSQSAWQKFVSVQYQFLDTLCIGDTNPQTLPGIPTMISLLRNLPLLQHLTLLDYREERNESFVRDSVELPMLRLLMIVECCHRMAYRLISNMVLPLDCRVAFIGGYEDNITATDAPCIMDAARRISATVRPHDLQRLEVSAWRSNQLVLCAFSALAPECAQHIPIPSLPGLAPRFLEQLGWTYVTELCLPSCGHMLTCKNSGRPWSPTGERELMALCRILGSVTSLTVNCCFCKAQLPFLASLIGPRTADGSSLFPKLDILVLHITPVSHNPKDYIESCRIGFAKALETAVRRRQASSDTHIDYLTLTSPECADVVPNKIVDRLEKIVRSFNIIENW